MKDQAMAQLRPFFRREEFHQVLLHLHGVSLLRQSKSSAESADVGIDNHAGDVEGIAEHHVGGFAADAGELGKGFE